MDHHSGAFVGIDTSKLRNAVAVAQEARGGEVRYLGEIETTEAATRKLVCQTCGTLTPQWAFHRSELVALDVADLEETEEGMRVAIRRSKTDQEGKGEVIAIVRGSVNCPVKAVKNWLQATSRLTDKSVAGIIKGYARRLGLNEADFSGHSLRSGFLTSAARRGASVFKMRDVSRHKSMDVLQSYIRDAELFRDHAGAGLL